MPTHHVILGGGPAATGAIETIREFDGGTSRITLVCDEPAHSRMALPYWLSGQIPREHMMTADEAYYRELAVEPRIGLRATGLDPERGSIELSEGPPLGFDNLLIATGASPIGLPIPGADLPAVQPLWTLAHTQAALDAARTRERPRVVMIGSGFIGFIMLNAMYKRRWQLSVVERESRVLPRMLDAEAARLVEAWLARKGIDLHCGTTATEIRPSRKGPLVALADGSELEADLVVIATGVKPNAELAVAAGIEAAEGVEGGILVDDHMRTNFSNIYAGGDAAKGPALFSEERAVHAIQPTAVDHGRIAGANMAGRDEPYPGSLLMNILDVCGLQCASFGNWSDSRAEAMTISNPEQRIHRSLLWTGDEITGAIFVGHANDLGMLTDVGMVKGIMQTQTRLGPWKSFLAEKPFDIRRPFVATKVAQKLAGATLVGRPSRTPRYRFGSAEARTRVSAAHAVYVDTGKD